MNDAIKYQYTSTDGRQIDVLASYVRNDTLLVIMTVAFNAEFEAQLESDQQIPFTSGSQVEQSVLLQYALDSGYTLKRINHNGSVTTMSTALSAMTPISASDDAGDVFVSWTGSDTFEVHRSAHGNKNFQKVAEVGGNYSDSDVITGVEYFYRVRRYDGSGRHSAFSNVTSFTAV